MKNFMIVTMMVFATICSADAQFGGQEYPNYADNNNEEKYYYDDEFDWHWDIRVRISNGMKRGLITQNEANRLYRRLELVERKEYAYLSDGVFSGWEQREIWGDVAFLNRKLGVELRDFDRRFYGFDLAWNSLRGYPRWYYQGGFDFYRFDRRGFGSIRLGYVPRSNYNGWYRNHHNGVGRSPHFDRDNRTNRSENNRSSRRENDRNPRGNYEGDNRRNDGGERSRNNNDVSRHNDSRERGRSNEGRGGRD